MRPRSPTQLRYSIQCAARLTALAAIPLVLGCARHGAGPAIQETPVEVPVSTPSVRGSQNGMEMMWWGVSADAHQLADLLAPYLTDNSVIDARTRALWQSNGLRLVCIPSDSLDQLRHLLTHTGGVQRQWLGQISLWTDVAHGSTWSDIQPVDMDNGRLDLGPGRLRLLLRCWTIPIPSSDAAGGVLAAMRSELLLQHQEQPRIDPATLYTLPTNVTNPLDEGLAFHRLAASFTLPPDHSLLVIPESPQVDWRALSQIPEDQLDADTTSLAETSTKGDQRADGDQPVGVGQVLRQHDDARAPGSDAEPPVPGPLAPADEISRTLGELLLIPNRTRLPNSVGEHPTVRSMLVLVPRIPTTYSIQPRAK